ncbi:protein TIPIN homolog [Wyeomyia smithii]|uniref:protein TIPIN homolog n=1 Tax=Wyeomyia smithii TaxID=174621 RepID=UPI002467F509|nr:protein TIPIN homolog [Wyeomyia smithii]XP_055546408.1 protein TIPIN homolog [Wyeomyia smithii]XP_055546409.1 protein TIPIN homolog [Wyeomyia smithii]XP_055546410.1 protein TIPIN homolog [Wyeomyia smithii]
MSDLFGGSGDSGDENAGRISDGDDLPDTNDDPEAAADEVAKPVKVEPKKRTVRNPRVTLNVQRLCGPRGVTDIENYFKNVRYRGKGHEEENLKVIMQRMQHWAHRMFPKYTFDDCLEKCETLGNKQAMKSYMHKYRMGMLEEPVVLTTEEAEHSRQETNVLDNNLDPLDSMLEEQIAISRAGNLNTSGVGYLSVSEKNFDSLREDSTSLPPSTPSKAPAPLTEEMRAKIAENRLKALEIRKTKMLAAANVGNEDESVNSAS